MTYRLRTWITCSPSGSEPFQPVVTSMYTGGFAPSFFRLIMWVSPCSSQILVRKYRSPKSGCTTATGPSRRSTTTEEQSVSVLGVSIARNSCVTKVWLCAQTLIPSAVGSGTPNRAPSAGELMARRICAALTHCMPQSTVWTPSVYASVSRA